MATTLLTNSTQIKYQQAVQFYTEKGIAAALKRQWQYIQESEQSDIMKKTIMLTIGAVTYGAYKGFEFGKEVADYFYLKGKDRQVVIICGSGAGFATGAAFSSTLSGVAIEHSKRLEQWKKVKIDNIIEDLMREEFEQDSILSQFMDAISQSPIFLPVRTPAGNVFDYDSLLKSCDENSCIKDVYNKMLPNPTLRNPNNISNMRYSIDACVKDHEMMIVIYKRFRHLATQKSKEPGLSDGMKEIFLVWRNSLGEAVNPIYMETQAKITKKRDEVQKKEGVTEQEAEAAEVCYNKEISIFKTFFGNTPLSDLNWEVTNNWSDLLNKRWMAAHHN